MEVSSFRLGVADLARNQLFAIARNQIGKALSQAPDNFTEDQLKAFKANAARLVDAILEGVTHAYPESMRGDAKVEFLINGFFKPSAAIKNMLLQTPQFAEYRKDAFSSDLGL